MSSSGGRQVQWFVWEQVDHWRPGSKICYDVHWRGEDGFGMGVG